MKQYQIQIKGMHCKACSTLISMNLEDEGFESTTVNLETKIGTFQSDKVFEEVKELSEKAVSEAGEYLIEQIKEV